MDDDEPVLSIGQAAERTGLSVHTLRFYEREELLPRPVRRDSRGRRVYGETDLEWLLVCANLRASDMPLPEIRRYTALVREGPGNEEERLSLLLRHRDRVAARIAELGRRLDLIGYKADYYAERIADGTAHRVWSPPPPGGG
ncbi:MerR family transcriptional regulator [Nocardiopsis potens]|uniref:MerR family transcriptional regulator n=1 Tax=Nocardiopsis potens TaxID=1246458 RepID=UPI000348974A|nr:MerR family transcriptional regulator [Nocardiopsis potens]